jgi:hypothetical protein
MATVDIAVTFSRAAHHFWRGASAMAARKKLPHAGSIRHEGAGDARAVGDGNLEATLVAQRYLYERLRAEWPCVRKRVKP